ncbi:hypothetical protein JXA34_04280 [Patescibacteria group bacterium]|nr:hypothetical protein [Patescibacteria group bacterium]
MNKVNYHLLKPNVNITPDLFGKMISLLNEMQRVIINSPSDEQNTAYISYENAPFGAKLTLKEFEETEKLKYYKLPRSRVLVECDKTDNITIYILQTALQDLKVRIYNTKLKCLLPVNPTIVDCTTYTSENHEKAVSVMEKFDLAAVFLLNNSYNYYAVSKNDQSVHFVNDNLLYHLITTESEPPKTNEFSYKVADNLEDFVRKFDFELIPTDFYKYYKRSFKIMNFSGFNIKNPGRKVFVKPYILNFDDDKYDFFKIAWDESALLFMDKIRKGETLNDTILRILREELKICNDYVGATVARIVEYDLDRNNVLTPRLILRIFVEGANLSEEQKAQKDRTWISFDQVKKPNRI